MAIFCEHELDLAEAFAELASTNPFTPRRIALERRILGDAFIAGTATWSLESESYTSPNLPALNELAEQLATSACDRLQQKSAISDVELRHYHDLVLYVLYHRHEAALYVLLSKLSPRSSPKAPSFAAFTADVAAFVSPLPAAAQAQFAAPAQLFALFYQLRRAFEYVYRYIWGRTPAAAQLRAAVWQSIFTHDLRRYRRALFDRMHDIPTLITGPSGTGKDLVATAIGYARYIPFDGERGTFATDYRKSFLPLHLAALSPTLIESELFGHCKGAFTGALADRTGYLEGKHPCHTIFLDEIGEASGDLQVKLLRVLQNREFRRIGDTTSRRFEGKIVAATNRDLDAALRAGSFRHDLYYRLCADLIRTPSLAQHLEEDPAELDHLVLSLATREVGSADAAGLTDEVLGWIDQHLGRDYNWPGNMRELEQCVRNVLVRKEYHPALLQAVDPTELDNDLSATLTDFSLSVDDLVSHYCTRAYAQLGSYEEVARHLQLDRRTVKAKIDKNLLRRLRGSKDEDKD